MRGGGIRPTCHDILGNPFEKNVEETDRVDPNLREDVGLSRSREEQHHACVGEKIILNAVLGMSNVMGCIDGLTVDTSGISQR